jgi:alpha-tubulin suppressor-like RCC1 family protein
MGLSYYGELGDGTYGTFPTYGTNRPVQITNGVAVIAAGQYHSLFVMTNGSLWAMGYDNYGQLGDGTSGLTDETNLPEMIVPNGVTMIAGGEYHSLFLTNDGGLWAMGYNEYGQLGNDTYGTYPAFGTNLPDQIMTNGITAIAAGSDHSLLLKSNGSLWATGDNEYGQLGDGSTDGGSYETNQFEQVVSGGVTAIAAGYDHSLFIKDDGSLWAMGDNQYGQLGDNTDNSQTNLPELIVPGPPGYNQISVQFLSGGNASLSYMGIAGTNYVLERTFSLSPANWTPQATNPAGAGGVLVFTNAPNPDTNNFWRVHSLP